MKADTNMSQTGSSQSTVAEPAPAPAPVEDRASIEPKSEAANQADRSPASELPLAELVAAELAARRRRWPFLLAGMVIGAAVAYGLVSVLDRAETDESDDRAPVELSSAPVESRDLLEEVDWDGTLQYGEPIEIAGTGGTVTAATPSGAALHRGDVIAAIDDQPLVLMYGYRPLWRTVEFGVEGVDVLLVETNLVNLGYDPDGTVTVDEEYTAATELMVERWQTDIGREVTGRVEPSEMVMVPGPAVVTSTATVGTVAQGVLATISPDRTVTDVVSALAGNVTGSAASGTVVEHGTVLYLIDEVAVVALGSAEIGVDPVLQALTDPTFTNFELEQALDEAGHDPDGEMTVDGIITDATTAAVERWQSAAGLPVTGRYDPGYYQPMPTGQAIDEVLVADGSTIVARPVMTASNSELRVEVVVGVVDADEFSEGLTVSIELADETTVEGVVAEVGAVERETPQSDATVTIVVEVLAGSDQELVEGGVTVTTISEAVEGAVTVPTRALVSLAEGGFAVEVIDGEQSDGEQSDGEQSDDSLTMTRLVAVELGAFDDGFVQVVEGDIRVGDLLVVPS